MQKNTAGQKWIVFAFGGAGHASEGEPITGDAANITANVRIDGGAANAVDDTNPTELEDGYYVFDITAAESNGDLISMHPESSTANVEVIGVPGAVYTTPANFPDMGIESDGHVHGDVKEVAGTAQTAGDIPALVTTVDTVVDAVQGDTQNILTRLPSALVGGRMDANVGAVSGDATAADNLEADYDGTGYNKANSTIGTVTTNTDMRGTDGANTTTPLSAAGTRTALGMASANLDTQLAALPTTAEVNAEVDTALADYDAPTKAELDAGFAGLNDPTAAEIVNEWETQSQADPTGFHVNLMEINSLSAPAVRLALSAGQIVVGAAETGTLSTTQMTSDLTEATDDHYIGRTILWTSGALVNQATDITDYEGTNGLLTFTATTEAPSNGDAFIII